MTEKRFTLTFDDKIIDNLTGIIHDVHSGYDVAMDLSELLNVLNDENELLKKYGGYWGKTAEARRKEIDQLKEENGQLKNKIDVLEDDIDYFYKTYEVQERGLDIVPAMCTMSSPIPSRRGLFKENERLKQALLFFLDIANAECSSSFKKDMEHDCQKLFHCSYDEAKKKYGSYDATWWELEE